jgi:hypothetical protein
LFFFDENTVNLKKKRDKIPKKKKRKKEKEKKTQVHPPSYQFQV